MTRTAFRNARIVGPDTVRDGDVLVADGLIAAVGDAGHAGETVDLEGDWLLPGLVELHTDHLERHYAPRSTVRWNSVAAVQAHDAQIAASGITTVLDALRVGADEDSDLGLGDMRSLAAAIGESEAAGRLRAEHFIHLRCEVSAPDVLDGFNALVDHPRVKMASLMDHTPGQRQFTDMDAYRAYYQGKTGISDAGFAALVARRRARAGDCAPGNRRAIAAACAARAIVLASHDDANADHIAEAVGHGVSVAEFPTTEAAARAARAAGLKVLMGAPNLVRGVSHSGNISARTLARSGLLDLLSSDYLPFSLLQAAFVLAGEADGPGLPAAVAAVSLNPAGTAGLTDRGAILPGRRADLVRVRHEAGVPIVRGVWRSGRRVV